MLWWALPRIIAFFENELLVNMLVLQPLMSGKTMACVGLIQKYASSKSFKGVCAGGWSVLFHSIVIHSRNIYNELNSSALLSLIKYEFQSRSGNVGWKPISPLTSYRNCFREFLPYYSQRVASTIRKLMGSYSSPPTILSFSAGCLENFSAKCINSFTRWATPLQYSFWW